MVSESTEVVTQEVEATQEVVEETKPEPVISQAEILKTIEGLEKKVSGFQSKADRAEQSNVTTLKELAETKRRLKSAEDTIKGVRGEFGDDADISGRLEDHLTKSELKAYKDRDAELEAKKAQDADASRRILQLKSDIEELGVDPKDARLNDAARGLTDIREIERTLMKEALKIAKGETKVSTTNLEMEAMKAELANLKKQLNIDSNETLPPVGGSGGKLTKDSIKGMSGADLMKNSAEIAKMGLTI